MMKGASTIWVRKTDLNYQNLTWVTLRLWKNSVSQNVKNHQNQTWVPKNIIII